MSEQVWCVASIDRPSGALRWCSMKRRVYGSEPRYREYETTGCCDLVVTAPCGYERRLPTCDGAR